MCVCVSVCVGVWVGGGGISLGEHGQGRVWMWVGGKPTLVLSLVRLSLAVQNLHRRPGPFYYMMRAAACMYITTIYWNQWCHR